MCKLRGGRRGGGPEQDWQVKLKRLPAAVMRRAEMVSRPVASGGAGLQGRAAGLGGVGPGHDLGGIRLVQAESREPGVVVQPIDLMAAKLPMGDIGSLVGFFWSVSG
jgi:hypothetical protein